MKSITLLGSTGSIGTSTLDVVRAKPDLFHIFALAAGSNTDTLALQILEFRPRIAILETEDARVRLIRNLEDSPMPRSDWPQIEIGSSARVQAATATETDFVLSAIVGVAGLEATYQAARVGKSIGLANKETMVASGDLVMAAARDSGAEVIPVDSEHNGAHQCFRCGTRQEVTRLILTASGGPFRNTPARELAAVTPEQALRHPTWKMGPRITIDSATMMNKGLEVIEACRLFDLAPGEVDVVVHPQSSVHAMVEFDDGSVMAQLSTTDMRMPIQYALTWPDRLSAAVPRMDWTAARTLEFFPPEPDKFPLLGLAYQALRAGGTAACTLNAADEIAVEAFLQGAISFPGIAELVEETLTRVAVRTPGSVDEILAVDSESRAAARKILSERSRTVSAS
ncbi:MAG: 1-deoxy-D-xylulose-5-phosphate reductoisomerase [Bryobacteraceae bacterium]